MALGAAAVLVVTGCSSTVEVTAAGAAGDAGCVAAAAAYPGEVSGMPRRTSSADDAGAGAWGDPPVIARCGVAAHPPTEVQCLEIDGVGWIPEELSDGTRFTSFGTDPALEILVPDDYTPEPLLLPAFSDAVRALPTNGLACR